MWLTRFSLKQPVIVAMVFIALALFGLYAYFFQIGRSQNPPGTEFPLVFVAAEYPGASPQDMEKLVVKPIEDQLQGLEHVDQITASSQEGEAEVDVQFNVGTNLDLAAVDVQRRVDTARVYMPADLVPPDVGKAGSSEPLMTLAIRSKSLSPTQLGDVVNNELVPMLDQIPNIETVSVHGVQTREFHVEPNPMAMVGLGATLGDVYNTVSAENANLPGGRIDKPTQETTVSVLAEINNAADLAAIPLAIPGNNTKLLRVGDVATTTDSFADQRYISRYNGQARVNVTLSKSLTADEVTTTAKVRDQLKQIEPQFPQLAFAETDVPADYTTRSLNGVWQSLFEGILLTAIVMMLFLHAWRNAIVVMVAIPTSILSTFVAMNLLGFTFDFMSLMALSLIIGILVDDSIVVLENITRHRDLGESPTNAAINGRSEIGSAAIAITLVDVIVFLPIAFLPGIIGMYLREFGLVVVIATLFSLLVSFTLTPLLAGKWSVKERAAIPPAWLESVKSPKVYAVMAVAAAILWFLPWTYCRVLAIILVALIALNAFVHGYDKIVRAYHIKLLPMAMRHGYFVVFVCFTLVLNAFFMLAGGIVSAGFDAMLIVGLVLGLGVGLFYRSGRRGGRLAPIDYMRDSRGLSDILMRHVRALTPARSGGARFAAQRNLYRFIARSSAGMYRNRRVTFATFGLPLALMFALVGLGQISTDFVPSAQTGSISMSITYPTGTPILTTSKYVDALSAGIMKIDGIKTVSSTVGYKPTGYGSTDGGNYAVLSAQTLPERVNDTNTIIGEIRDLSYLVPGGDLEVSGSDSSGSGAPIFYALQGPDAVLNQAADKVVAFLRSTPGTVNVESSAEVGAPRLNITIDPARAAILGVSPSAAANVARLAVGGAVATRVRTSSGLTDVRVQLSNRNRDNLDVVRNIRVRANDGTLVPLSAIASFTNTVAPTKVERLNRERVVNVTGGLLPGYSLGGVTGPLQAKLKEQGFLPPGVHLEEQGDTQFMVQTFTSMGLAALISGLLVYMLMVVLYGSVLEPLIVMFSVPMALIGALFGLVIMHLLNKNGTQSLNLLSGIGTIMLFGLVAKNGILLVDYSNTLIKRGMHVRDAVLGAAATRFRPILMTTFAMVFGMLPLALGFAEGAEWRQSMGTVIIGGLISSLILTLFLVPMIYDTWIGFVERLKDRKAVYEEMAPVGQPANA
jgi:multidrug efflux pump subunit AcrB